MKVGVVGSREFPWDYMVRNFVSLLPVGWQVVSGGARGVDTWAVEEAIQRGMPYYVFHAKSQRTADLFARNAEIAYDCDVLVPCHIGEFRYSWCVPAQRGCI